MSLHSKIRVRFQLGPAYHLTHVDNLDAIFATGSIHSYNRTKGAQKSIANEDVQAGRASITIPQTGRPLHDYVPLYFGFKSPMVAVNQHQNESLVFLRFSLDLLDEVPDIVIADGNARARGTKFTVYKTLDDLACLDTKAILTVKYAHDPEIKRKKQAELLIPDELAISKALDIICFSGTTRNSVISTQRRHGMNIPVFVNRGWYFIQRPKGGT